MRKNPWSQISESLGIGQADLGQYVTAVLMSLNEQVLIPWSKGRVPPCLITPAKTQQNHKTNVALQRVAKSQRYQVLLENYLVLLNTNRQNKITFPNRKAHLLFLKS